MMSILDRVTKAVGDAVDRGKKEVDLFVRIQKINGEIGDVEKRIAEFKRQIQAARQEAGEKAIELLRAGTLVSPDLQPFLEQVGGIEQQIAAEEGAVAEKRAEIEKLKAEHEAEKAAAGAAPEAPPPEPADAGTVQATPPLADSPATPGVTPPSPARFCPHCGARLAVSGAFCPHCGAKTA
jgi:hypothetical protein